MSLRFMVKYFYAFEKNFMLRNIGVSKLNLDIAI